MEQNRRRKIYRNAKGEERKKGCRKDEKERGTRKSKIKRREV